MPDVPLDANDRINVTRHNTDDVGVSGSVGVDEIDRFTHEWQGWAEYRDSQYTSGSPFTFSNNTWTDLPNNGLLGPKTQLPTGIDLYDGTHLTGRLNDGIVLTVEFTGMPTTGTLTYLDIAIDIGGSIGRIYNRTLEFPKGQGVARTESFTVFAYTLDTWTANGGKIVVNSNAALSMYDVRYVISRQYRAR
jgi:hypothetical protein